MNNPFVKNFDYLFQYIECDIEKDNQVSLYIASDKADSIFEKVLVQELVRTIDNQEIKFIAIRNIELKEKYKSQKSFTKFVEQLETLNYPIMYHDIVNDKLKPFFEKKGYQIFKEKKYEQEVISMYKK